MPYEIDAKTGKAKLIRPASEKKKPAVQREKLPPIEVKSVAIAKPGAPRVGPRVERMLPPEPDFDIVTTAADLGTMAPVAPEPAARTFEGDRTGLLEHAGLIDALYAGKFPPLQQKVRRGPSGRPIEYSKEVADRVVVLATKSTLKKLCALHVDMPSPGLVRVWILDNVDGFAERWKRARRIFLDGLVDEVLEISDDDAKDFAKSNVSVQRSKLRTDSRIWMLTKLNRELFGNAVEADPAKQNAGSGAKENVSNARERLASFINRSAASGPAPSSTRTIN